MKINREAYDGHIVVRVLGGMTGENANELASVPPIEAASSHVILDLTQLESMDSIGLGVLVMISTTFRKSPHRLVIIAPQGLIRKSLKLSLMDQLNVVRETLEKAIEALSTE